MATVGASFALGFKDSDLVAASFVYWLDSISADSMPFFGLDFAPATVDLGRVARS